MIPYGKQDIDQNDIDAVLEVLKSDFLTQGPRVPEFEESVKACTGAAFAVAVNSATSALHLSCLALGLGQGDLLWTSPVTFVASSNCALYCGAQVDFVDIDPLTYNMCPEKLRKKLLIAEKEGRLPKVIIPVHLSGQSCNMKAIKSLSDEFGFSIIEDASHAIGGKYKGESIGGCRYSDITVFSFHPVKIVTTAEGGVAVTNRRDLADKISLLRSHGVTRDAAKMVGPSHGGWYYQQVDLGFNYRMTELQAALGSSQMQRLSGFIQKRHDLALRYNQLLASLPLKLPYVIGESFSAWHLYIVRLKLDEITCTHKEVFDLLRARGVGVNLHYIPVHTQPYYRELGFADGDFPESESYYREAISLPVFHSMTYEQQDTVVSVLTNILTGG